MKSYLVLEMTTGAMDGFYATKELAMDMIPCFKEKYPDTEWLVLEVVGKSENSIRIFDHMFHVNKLGFFEKV